MRRRPVENVVVEDRSAEPACVTLGHQWGPKMHFLEVHVPKGAMRAPSPGFCRPFDAEPRYSVNLTIGCHHCDATLNGVTLIAGGLKVDPTNPRTLIQEDR